MKKLLIKLAFLLLIIAVLGLINYKINSYFFDVFGHQIDSETTTVVCGASITRNALNDSILPYTENISLAGRSALDFYLVSKRILRDHPQVKRIITDYTIQGMSGFRDYMFYHPKFASTTLGRIYPLADYAHISDYPLNYKFYIKSLLRHKFTPDIMYWKNALHQWIPGVDYEIPYIGQYEDRKGNDLDPKALEEGIERYFYFHGEPFPVVKIDAQYMDSLVHLTEKFNVELILFSGPLHSSGEKYVPQKFLNAYRDGKLRYQEYDHVSFLEYTYYPLPDSCFANHNHLNGYGARIISELVSKELFKPTK